MALTAAASALVATSMRATATGGASKTAPAGVPMALWAPTATSNALEAAHPALGTAAATVRGLVYAMRAGREPDVMLRVLV